MFCSAQTAEALGHDLREILILSGELDPREAERIVWDVIVVGTGMGGGVLGYSLARSGRRVLFVEKGRSTLPGVPGTIRSAIPEVAEPLAAPFRRRPTTTPWPAPDAPPTRSKTSAGASRGGLCRASAAEREDPRRSTAWFASDFSLAISLPGRTFAIPAIRPCRMPGRSPTTR